MVIGYVMCYDEVMLLWGSVERKKDGVLRVLRQGESFLKILDIGMVIVVLLFGCFEFYYCVQMNY